jgi:hypothetical protein
MPSYVSVSVERRNTTEADAVLAEQGIVSYVNALAPTDVVEVSEIERVLHEHGIKGYAHPFYVFALAHDLDRRLVLTKSEDTIGTIVDHNGSNRTTFYVPGPVSANATVYGESIRVPTTTLSNA